MKNCKVIPGEVVIRKRKKRLYKMGENKIKAWKLEDPIKRRMLEDRER